MILCVCAYVCPSICFITCVGLCIYGNSQHTEEFPHHKNRWCCIFGTPPTLCCCLPHPVLTPGDKNLFFIFITLSSWFTYAVFECVCLCSVLHGDALGMILHTWDYCLCKPTHCHISLTVTLWSGVWKPAVTDASLLSPLLSTMILIIKCYSFCFHYQISFIKLKEENALLYAWVFLGFFCCCCLCSSFFIPNAPEFLLSSFPFHLKNSLWPVVKHWSYVTNSSVFPSLGCVFISSSVLKDHFPKYEIHG